MCCFIIIINIYIELFFEVTQKNVYFSTPINSKNKSSIGEKTSFQIELECIQPLRDGYHTIIKLRFRIASKY